jgi:hypothetical protein
MLSMLIRGHGGSSIPTFLSEDVPVAAKAGITAGSVNNAGIIFVSSKSHVVLCVFFKKLEEKNPEKAQMAEGKIARLIYDHFSKVHTP